MSGGRNESGGGRSKGPSVPVMCCGLGAIGSAVARHLLDRTAVRVVAAVDIDPAKVSLDLGTIVGGRETGITVEAGFRFRSELTDDSRAVALLTTTSSLADTGSQVLDLLDGGWNVLSTCEELSYPYGVNPDLSAEIDERARQAGLSVLGAGINPGFLLDGLVLVLTGACLDVSSVIVSRTVDTNARRIPLQQKVGIGLCEQEFRELADQGRIGHVGLRQSAEMVAHGLGWKTVSYDETIEPVLATSDVFSGLGRIAAKSVIGQRQRVILRADSGHTIEYRLEMSVGADEEDTIHIKGNPEILQKVEGGINGDVGTIGIVTNLLPVLGSCPPGLLTMASVLRLAQIN